MLKQQYNPQQRNYDDIDDFSQYNRGGYDVK